MSSNGSFKKQDGGGGVTGVAVFSVVIIGFI